MLSKLSTPSKWWKWLTAATVFLVMLLVSARLNVTGFPWDSSYYLNIADPVVFEGGFHLLNYPATYRGYLFPTIVAVFKYVAIVNNHGLWGWRILIALMLAIFLAFVLPELFSIRIDTAIRFLRTMLCFAVILWIWGYYFQHPLSDLPAAFFLCAGAALLKRLTKDGTHRILFCVLALCAGWLFYAAYNTRIAMLFGTVPLLVLFAVRMRKEWRKLLLALVLLFFGATIAAFPQVLLNHQYVGGYSPKVYTDLNNEYDHDLVTQQIYWGIEYPRYGAYIGDPEVLPYGATYYLDPAGIEMLEREGLTSENFALSDFGRLLQKYPLDMVALYMRHLISVMTPTYTTEPYITEMYTEKGLLITCSILIWMLSFLAVRYGLKEKRIGWMTVLGFLSLCLPSLLQMAGAPETRFFLLLYLFAYFGVFTVTDYRRLWAETKGKRGMIAVGMIVIYCLWVAIVGSMLSLYQHEVLLIHDRLRP